MKLIVGLGNPGARYQDTRHNVGFLVAAESLKFLGNPSPRTKFLGEVAEGRLGEHRVAVLCPMTYMNASGNSIRRAVDFFKIELGEDRLLVICDDLNLPLGRIRFRQGGSAGGQKGLADTIAKLGTDRFARLRIGIDRPPPSVEVVDYVLGKFSVGDQVVIRSTIERSAMAVGQWVQFGTQFCMNQFNAASGDAV